DKLSHSIGSVVKKFRDCGIHRFTAKCSISWLAQFRTENCSTSRLEKLRTLTDPTMEIFPRCRHDFAARDQSAVLADKEKPRHAGAFQ
ncbi:hypothetical protein, partial [Mesorhizobium sp.]|uniref:hypothetical protein n=1 Tax=Mesorhizobium sp. TaxID=1871066 RepID=UPI0025B8813C